MRHPAQGEAAARIEFLRDRAPAGFPHRKLDRRPALDANALDLRLDRSLALGRAITRVLGIGPLHFVEIQPVAVAVGESPGDMAIAADDHRRNAGQGEAGNVDAAARRFRIGVQQACAKPEVRRAQAQVHVVGDDGATIGGERAVHREVVAAGRRRFRHGVLGLDAGHRQLSQIDDIGGRQGDVAARFAQHRCVPFGAVGGDQRVQGRGQVLADLPQREFARIRFVLQVEEHREAGERRVFRTPVHRLAAQQQVGPGAAAQRMQAGIDAFRVRREHRHAFADDRGDVLAGAFAQPMHADGLVAFDRDGAEQLGQFAGGGASQQVHFEEAFLAVHIAEGARGIGFVGGVHGDDAERISFDGHRCAEPGQGQFAVELGEAAAQHPPGGQEGQQQGDQQQQEASGEPAQGSGHGRCSVGDAECSHRRGACASRPDPA